MTHEERIQKLMKYNPYAESYEKAVAEGGVPKELFGVAALAIAYELAQLRAEVHFKK
jgi:hypothetical protein